MTIERFFVNAGTILHPALVASYGDGTELDYDAGTEADVIGWLHQLSELEQQSATRDAEVSTHVYRVPLTTTISASDRVRIGDQLFDVDGPPSRNSYGNNPHLRVSLRYTDG